MLTSFMITQRKKRNHPLDKKGEVLIAKSQSLQSQDLAITPKSSILQNPPREEVILPLKILDGGDFGKIINF